MPLPKTVDILGKPYRVEVDPAIDATDYGHCVADQCLIRIAKRQCEMQKRDTILHEVTHGIEHELKLNMKENQVHRLATGWLSVMRHNPKLVEFLMAEDE